MTRRKLLGMISLIALFGASLAASPTAATARPANELIGDSVARPSSIAERPPAAGASIPKGRATAGGEVELVLLTQEPKRIERAIKGIGGSVTAVVDGSAIIVNIPTGFESIVAGLPGIDGILPPGDLVNRGGSIAGEELAKLELPDGTRLAPPVER